MSSKKPIINAHAHCFTSQFVPPFLAKTIVLWPLYYIIHTQWIVRLAKSYFEYSYRFKYPKKSQESDSWQKIYKKRRSQRRKTMTAFYIKTRPLINIPYRLIVFWLSLVALLYTLEFLAYLFNIQPSASSIISKLESWMAKYYLWFDLPIYARIIWVGTVLVFINWSRRMIWFGLKSLFPILKKLLSHKGLELFERYMLMGRFALYKRQTDVAQRALSQLPPDSQMVLLPMDMEYMGAGKTKLRKDILNNKAEKLADGWLETDFSDTFKYQMRELWDFVATNRERNAKKNLPPNYHPFLFIDPRRVAEEGSSFFDYTLVNNKMQLKDCYVKTYMEDRAFSGFKIYPALGYYPFDEHLLPIWRYASENNIPIMAHCVIGTIYYRGKKKKAWNFHPVFKQQYTNVKDGDPEPMLLPQVKNVDQQFNFTHPMNYLCLLEEVLLKRVLKNVQNKDTQALFGYVDDDTPLSYTLENLKVCLAHYGGEEEWIKYLETDRDVFSRRMITAPDEGIQFMKSSKNILSEDKLNTIWHDVDWYAIISSMLMQYENMYADLSYIISKPSIYPLLDHTLEKGMDYENELQNYEAEPSDNKKASHLNGRNRLRAHILFGTDFYVVRNHNSDKDLFIEARAAIGEEKFDLIARENTHNYLSRL